MKEFKEIELYIFISYCIIYLIIVIETLEDVSEHREETS